MLLHLIYLACLLGSSIVAFIYRRDLKSRRLFLFPYFLMLVAAQEIFVYCKLVNDPSFSTGIVYNIYNPVNTSFFVVYYGLVPFNAAPRKLMTLLLVIFLAIVVITFGSLQSLHVYNNYLTLAGGFLITLSGLLFLFNYFRLDNPEEEKKWAPVIWITIGLVAFYPVVNISFALYKYLQAYNATLFGMKLYRIIPQLMSIFMYGCFTRAFYLCHRKK